jgi:hypothetical protein
MHAGQISLREPYLVLILWRPLKMRLLFHNNLEKYGDLSFAIYRRVRQLGRWVLGRLLG